MNAKLFDPQKIFEAYIDCRKRKRGKKQALLFEKNQSQYLVTLTRFLQEGSYLPARSVCFMVKNSKPREIFAAAFYDRVVHHLLVRFLEEYWERVFIYDSYACRKSKGTLAAVERLAHFMRSVSKNGAKRAYYLQLDIRNFFMSVDKQILFSFLSDGLKRRLNLAKSDENINEFNEILWLIKIVLFHDPTKNYLKKSSDSAWLSIPPEKSLFNAKEGVGLPIGNLTSQFFANVYMNRLDQFIKHTLKVKYYIRYVDDFVILDESRERLKDLLKQIDSFLASQLKLELKRGIKLNPLSCGINFLGYVQHIDRRLVRRRVIRNFENKLNFWRERESRKQLSFQELEQIQSVATSYLAHAGKADSYKIILKTLSEHQWLKKYFKVKRWKATILDEIKEGEKRSKLRLYLGKTK